MSAGPPRRATVVPPQDNYSSPAPAERSCVLPRAVCMKQLDFILHVMPFFPPSLPIKQKGSGRFFHGGEERWDVPARTRLCCRFGQTGRRNRICQTKKATLPSLRTFGRLRERGGESDTKHQGNSLTGAWPWDDEILGSCSLNGFGIA